MLTQIRSCSDTFHVQKTVKIVIRANIVDSLDHKVIVFLFKKFLFNALLIIFYLYFNLFHVFVLSWRRNISEKVARLGFAIRIFICFNHRNPISKTTSFLPFFNAFHISFLIITVRRLLYYNSDDINSFPSLTNLVTTFVKLHFYRNYRSLLKSNNSTEFKFRSLLDLPTFTLNSLFAF